MIELTRSNESLYAYHPLSSLMISLFTTQTYLLSTRTINVVNRGDPTRVGRSRTSEESNLTLVGHKVSILALILLVLVSSVATAHAVLDVTTNPSLNAPVGQIVHGKADESANTVKCLRFSWLWWDGAAFQTRQKDDLQAQPNVSVTDDYLPINADASAGGSMRLLVESYDAIIIGTLTDQCAGNRIGDGFHGFIVVIPFAGFALGGGGHSIPV
jgi:hypothetical protein